MLLLNQPKPTARPGATTENAEIASTSDFFEACGGDQPIRLTVFDPQGSDVDCHHFERPFVLIGNSKDCDLQLVHPDVADRHIYLQMIDGRVAWFRIPRPSESTPANRPEELEFLTDGETIEVGPFQVKLDASDFPGPEQLLPADSPGAECPKVRLEFVNSAKRRSKAKAIELDQRVTLLGRGSNCHVRLSHNNVSRVHCGLIVTPGGLWVVDLLSRLGTVVERQQVTFRRIADNDELLIGKYRVRVRVDHKPEPDALPTSAADQVTALTSLGQLPVAIPSVAVPAIDATREPAAVPTGHFSEKFVMSLVQQFAAMQMDTFSQMNQIVTGMMESLSNTHQEHLALVREELARVDDLSREMQELRLQLAAAPTAPQIADAQTTETPPVETSSTKVPGEGAVAIPEPVPINIARKSMPQQPVEAPSVEPSAAMPTEAESSETRSQRERQFDASVNSLDIVQRLGELDRERSKGWQKILNLMSGASSN